MCQTLEVSTSGYYEWNKGISSQTEEQNRKLLTQIEVLFRAHKGRYGAPRIYRDLQKQGFTCSKNRVARLMQKAGLRSRYKKVKRPKPHSSGGIEDYAPNHLAREFEAEQSGERWVTDIKYIWTDKGWCYLCVVIDLFGRELVGWSVKEHMEDGLVVKALIEAMERRGMTSKGLIHSDRGSQFTSKSTSKR